MMPSSDLERFAILIADNVVSGYARKWDSTGRIDRTVRDIVTGKLVQSLLRVLPSNDGKFLAAVCNFTLADTLGGMDHGGPRVEAVDPAAGSVTMRDA